jgi:hypothetical protein
MIVDVDSTNSTKISFSFATFEENIKKLSERFEEILYNETHTRVKSIINIIELLFGARKDLISIKFTRAHSKMLKLASMSRLSQNIDSLVYSQHNRALHQKFVIFTQQNYEILKKYCNLQEKNKKKFNKNNWKEYFSSEIVIESFQIFIEIVFSDTDKDKIMRRISKNHKISENEHPELWSIRKGLLENLFFMF